MIYCIMSWNDLLLWAFLSRNALVGNWKCVCFSGTFGHCDQVSELWWYESLPNLQRQRAVHEVLFSGETPQTCNNWLVWILLIIQEVLAWYQTAMLYTMIFNYHKHMPWDIICPETWYCHWCISKSLFINIVAFPKTWIGSFEYVLVKKRSK